MDYIELHTHSAFSLLDGASLPEALVARAADLGMPALALTDHDSVAGAVAFVEAARAHAIRPLLGAELTLAGERHLTLLAADATGWANLCTLISRAQASAPKGQAELPAGALADHTAGLIALSGCRHGPLARLLRRGDAAGALAAARRLHALFGDRLYIELQHHLTPGDDALVRALSQLASQLDLPIVATNNVHYATRAGKRVQDVLTCLRHHLTLAEAGSRLRPNDEAYLKPAARMQPLFAGYPHALVTSLQIAGRCSFTLDYGLQDLPAFPAPPGNDATGYLYQLCQDALETMQLEDGDQARRQLAYELGIIARAGLSNYMLIVWDIVRFCRSMGIRCQGRGSAAGSLVAYLLGISPINPLAHHLTFERFLSDERPTLPDIDLDIQADRREEVIQYVYQRYGPAHVAMACSVITFQRRLARRDVARVLGLDPQTPGASGPVATLVDELCDELDGLPRHLGIHNGGMVVMGAPLATRLPVEPAALPGRSVVQWDKAALEIAGLVKIDLLGLRMLSAIDEAVVHAGHPQLPEAFDDPAIYDLLCAADTIGVFQVESRAQAQLLPRLRPRCFDDLVVAISLIRPGPLQGQMVHPYLRRRLGLEPVTFLHPRLAAALGETLGVILFQEQVLRVAHDLAGFTPGQGEVLRRALGHKRAGAAIERLHAAFLAGAIAGGVPPETAEQVFTQLRGFGGYSFPKSHAAAFAVLVYQSAYLKRYHPAAFYTALLNHQPMGFWSPAVLIGDARRHNIPVLPVDITRSAARCTLTHGAIRLGLNYVGGLGPAAIGALEQARAHRPFTGLADLQRRSGLGHAQLEALIRCGALDGWGQPRRQLLWTLGTLPAPPDALGLDWPPTPVELPALSRAEALAGEYAVLGLSTSDHPLALLRGELQARGILRSAELAHTTAPRATVAGVLVVHQAPPTAQGHHFLTLEDEDGLVNVIVRPALAARWRERFHGGTILIVTGEIQRAAGALSLLALRIAGW